jgi:predicted ester cyclase
MDQHEIRTFAERLMNEVWIPYDGNAVAEFYHSDVKGHHGTQDITFDEIVTRLQTDGARFGGGTYDIQDILAGDSRFAIRFRFRAQVNQDGTMLDEQVAYFYHLLDGKISEFWLFADLPFDYNAKP